MPTLVARYSSLYQVLRASHRQAQTSSQVVWLLGGGYLQVRPHRLAAILAQAQPERPGFQLVLDALAYLQVVARAYEAQLLVVIQPSKEMTYLLHHDETAPAPSRALRQALEQRGVESLDLTPNFQQWASTGEPLFFTANRYPNAQGQALNRYPNAQGQALIAQEVVRHLTAAAQTYGLTP